MTQPTQSDSLLLDELYDEASELVKNGGGTERMEEICDELNAIYTSPKRTALYAPKPDVNKTATSVDIASEDVNKTDETVERILQCVYNNGRMADKKLMDTSPPEILPWVSIDDAKYAIAAHYAAKEQEAVLRARIDENCRLENTLLANTEQPSPFTVRQILDGRIKYLTNQLNQLKGNS